MKYCTKCLIPDTRPDQIFDKNGVCNACRSHELKEKIDWSARQKELDGIIENIKKIKNKWNCVIPSSGGKDSAYQALWAKKKGLNPVLVTASTCDLSIVGRSNIENLKNIGFDTVEISTNPIVRKKLNRISLETIGDISWPEHVSIFTIPIKFALHYKIPLILYGENPQLEYGGPQSSLNNSILDRKWMEEFGGLIGFRVNDLKENYGFSSADLNIFEYPSKEELGKFEIKSLFLGYYEKWDPYRNYDCAKKNGFENYNGDLEGCYFNWEKIDNYQHGIHDYFKYLKFGFGRATDQLSYLIRSKKITRENAIMKIKSLEGNFPKSYMGKSLEDILKKIDMSTQNFKKICDRFTNKKIFDCDQGGNLRFDDNGNLIKRVNY